MIIKSMARKAPSFGQLISYIGRDADGAAAVFARNLYHNGADAALVAQQFQRNYAYLPKRKNGNALYHEVIVLEPQEHLPQAQVHAALLELAEAYCARRAPEQLAWGRIHTNTDYPHIHLMISANGVRSARRVRLERAEFGGIQKDLEQFREQHFPQLKGVPVYRRDRSGPKRNRGEGELERRSGKPSRKTLIHEQLSKLMAEAGSREELSTLLAQQGLELYNRGKHWGVIDQQTGLRYRLQTLGLGEAFARLPERSPPILQHSDPADPRITELLLDRAALEQEAERQLNDFERDRE